jgi:hypothetical protein
MSTSDQNAEEPRPPKDGDDDGERTEGGLAPGRTGSSLPEAELDDPDDDEM